MGAPGFPKNGKPLVDAKKDLVVHVTKDCVTNAKAMDPTQCVVAKAICKLDGVVSARVQIAASYIEYPTRIVRYLTPQSIGRELVSFDRHGPFDVGDYILKAPSPSRRLGTYHQAGRDPNRPHKGGKPRNAAHRTLMVRRL